jgi:ABC-type amino acid transport substrate-binding protein
MIKSLVRNAMNPGRMLAVLLGMAFIGVAAAPSDADTLDQIKKSGVIRIGTGVLGLKPWLWQEPNGEYTGVEADLARRIAKELGVKPEFVITEWTTLIPGLKADRWDIIISSMAKSEERINGGGIQFSNPYFLIYDQIRVKAESPVHSQEDLKGKVVGSAVGTIDSIVAHTLKDKGILGDVKDFNTQNEPFFALQNDQVDAVIIDPNVFNAQKDQFPGMRIVMDNIFFVPKPEWAAAQDKADYIFGGVAIGVRKEDDRLREQLNSILAKLEQNGERKALFVKYGVWSPLQENLMKH